MAPLVLRLAHKAHDIGHHRGIEPSRLQGLAVQAALHVGFQDRVQHIIGRQAVLVFLVGPQLGRGWLAQGRLRDHRTLGVDLAGNSVHQRFGHIRQHSQAAAGVAVEGAIARRDLALVPSRKQQSAQLVRQGHEDAATDARLQILLGDIGRPA